MPRVRSNPHYTPALLEELRAANGSKKWLGEQLPSHRGLSALRECAALLSNFNRARDRELSSPLTEEEIEVHDAEFSGGGVMGRVDFETNKGQYYNIPNGLGTVGQAAYFALCDMRGIGWKIPRKLKKRVFGTVRRNSGSWRARMEEARPTDPEKRLWTLPEWAEFAPEYHAYNPHRGWTWEAFQKFRRADDRRLRWMKDERGHTSWRSRK